MYIVVVLKNQQCIVYPKIEPIPISVGSLVDSSVVVIILTCVTVAVEGSV